MFIPLALLRRKRLASRLLSFGAPLALAGSHAPAQAPASANATLYSHGDPTAQEQYLLEQLNRARANPAEEGQRMAAWLRNDRYGKATALRFGFNPDAVAAQIAAFPAGQPLAFNAQLLAAARAHSADMAPHDGVGPGGAANPLNDHNGYDGSTPEGRVQASGYAGDYAGENFAGGFATPDVIHAAYFVDWGNPGLGHLQNSLQGGSTREVGIGTALLFGGADLTETEDYGSAGEALTSKGPIFADAPALLLGAAYTDANVNGQYDPGEGLAGVTVTMEGGAYYAVTSASGGYTLPLVDANGSSHDGAATVGMSGGALGGGQSAGVTVAGVAVPGYHGFNTFRPNLKWDAVVNAAAGGGSTPLAPPADGSTLLALGGGVVSKAAGGKTVITVRRAARNLSQPLTVAYKQKGTAVAGTDYKPLPGSITFPAGSDRAAFKVRALKGGAAEGPATLTLRLTKAPGEAVSAGEGKATIVINP